MPNGYTVAHRGPTPEQAEILCREAEKGWSVTACAAEAELNHWTVRSWVSLGFAAQERVARGEELQTDFDRLVADFAWEFSKARARGGRALEQRMTERADNDSGTWLEAFRKLERLHPKEWADHTRQAPNQGGIQIVIAGMLPERVVHVEGELVADDGADEGLPAAPAARSLPR